MILTASLLTKRLETIGGHFGYEIRPSFRRKGIAARALALGLIEIKKLGIAEVEITCDDDNLGSIGSIGVLEKNGGKLSKTYSVPNWCKPIRKYVFALMQ